MKLHDYKNLSGLEYHRLVASGELPRSSMGLTMGVQGYEVEPGKATFWATTDERHLNPAGNIHGGFAATLLDTATGCALHTRLPAGDSSVTTDLTVKMLRPVPRNSGVVVKAEVVHEGRRLGVVEGRLYDAQERLCATATATLMITRKEQFGSRADALFQIKE